MSDTAFSINDLRRRKLQTTLTIISLTTCVASTLFLLLFSGQMGIGISSIAQNTLTAGTSVVFSQFLWLLGILIFAVGAVITSFIVYLTMAQRIKDFGLMKATGCRNGLVFGYFMTELLTVTLVGCVLGVILGLATDFAVINLGGFQVYNSAPNLWFVPLVFVVFFAFALFFGAKPLYNAARLSPIQALSPVQYFGLGKGNKMQPLSKTGITIHIATRSLFRRKSTTTRIVAFLSAVFLLLTVSIAGGIIANDTSTSWLYQATEKNSLLIADTNLANHYTQLMLTFSGNQATPDFNYTNPQLGIPDTALAELSAMPQIENLDPRIMWYETIQELTGYRVDPETGSTIGLGSNRECESIVIGVDTQKMSSMPFTTGEFLNSSELQAVVGDSIAQTIYKPIKVQTIVGVETRQADALRQGVSVQDIKFKITGICLDPLNNGNVTYIPLTQMQKITGLTNPNILIVKLSEKANVDEAAAQIQNMLSSIDPDLTVISLNEVTAQNADFLSSLWSVIMFLPAFAVVSASLCLISFLMLAIDEQHQEFAILRATGAKPRTILTILAVQSATVLLSSFGIGVSFGTIITILILTTAPVISAFTALAITGWLFGALAAMFLLSLYPAVKFSKQPLLKILS
ncbi:MAG: ABC transporter permease [Candidatus Bathyarchaeota archaeon]|nr:ABC transporter permease [Candidatus Bathyarchaeota archaeon]